MAGRFCILLPCLLAIAWSVPAGADELTLENVTAPAANSAEEPLAEAFSPGAAARFLDQASLHWLKSRNGCFTCHTNYAYLLARPALGDTAPAQQQIRGALETLVEQRWEDKGPRWPAEVVMSAAVLAFHDARTTGKLHPATRKALERMWTVQNEDGGVTWLTCDWPPMESDHHYGATMVAIAAGVAPEGYAQTDAARQGLERLREYFRNNPPQMLHHTAMLIWAGSHVDGLISDQEREAGLSRLLELQNADGGWTAARLGPWERADGGPQDLESSDGYATGFVIYVLRRGGLAADDPRIQRGVAWLKANQRTSGRWFTRSLHSDSHHYLSHAGTAFAILALDSCGAFSP